MVLEISQERLTYIFIEGFSYSTRGLVSALDPPILEDAIKKATRLENARIKERRYLKREDNHFYGKEADKKQYLSKDVQLELWKKNQCYNCKEKWEPTHVCNLKENQEKTLCFKCKDPWALGHKCNLKDRKKKNLCFRCKEK